MSTIAETVPPCKDGLDKKTLLDFYWKYFDLHSRQRMQMVNFYITISIVLYGGLFALLQLETRLAFAEYFVAGFMIVISFCFHKLDRRNSELIHCCEERIKALEKGIESEYRLIEKSDEMTNENNRREKDVINKRYTYTEIFSILTVFVSASGVIYILLRFISAI